MVAERCGPEVTVMELSRRQFIASAAATVAGTLGLGGAATACGPKASPSTALPAPEQSGIDHVVLVMMENRSFDHYLGWLPGADGRQDLSFPDKRSEEHTSELQSPYVISHAVFCL